MSGERLNYEIERQRHEGFVGRGELLAQLDQLLVEGSTDRWVLVIGGPGMGKSALLATWLARREAASVVVPHHFIRRGEYEWDNPAKLVGSLVAQIEERFPNQRESDSDAQKHPAARLAAMLMRVSAKELSPSGTRLVVMIDGLDEYDPPEGSSVDDPLAAFLPNALPRGVSFLCASRRREPYVQMLEARDGELVSIDLDEPDFAQDNEATVRAFWKRAAPPLGLDAHFIDEAVARAGGNLQHAATLRKHVAGLPGAQRRVEDIPRGLEALLAKSWGRIARHSVAVSGIGILCAAREALTLDEIGTVAEWTEETQRQAFLHGASELLVETRRAGDVAEYRFHHASIRTHVTSKLGAAALRRHHAALAARLAKWPSSGDAAARQYALRYALSHRAEAGDWAEAWRLASDMDFLEAKCRELGAHEVEADVTRAAERCRADGDAENRRLFDDLARALARESHWLRSAPDAIAALVWNRLRRSGWRAEDIDKKLRIPEGSKFLRVRHEATRESPALVRDLIGHADRANSCAVTPDGRRVVSASADQTLKLWDLDSGRILAVFEGHTGEVNACVVTPDGRRVVSASYDRTLKVWELDSRRVLATFEGHRGRVTTCAVTPDGRVISGSEDGTLKVWSVGNDRALATFEGHTDWVRACAVTPDGRWVVSASDDRTLKVWDVESGSERATLRGHTHWVTGCAVSPDGRHVVSASEDLTLKVWDLESESVLATFDGHVSRVTACAVTPDGRRVVSASRDRRLKVWDLDTKRVLATFGGHTGWVTGCVVTPDGRRVISASHDETLKVWDLDSSHVVADFESHAHRVTECAVSSDGRQVVSASHDNTLKIWDTDSGRVLATLTGHRDRVTGCAMMSDGRRIISTSYDDTLKVWDLESGGVIDTIESHRGLLTACAVTFDGRRAVSAFRSGQLEVWDLESRSVVVTFDGHDHVIEACAVTTDGRRVISASWDDTLKVWDIDSRTEIFTCRGHTDVVSACAVTPDGRRMVSASHDRTLKVWDLESGRLVGTLEGHAGPVTTCAVMRDGRRAVSASVDQTLKVWDLDTLACLFTHRGDASYTAVAATETGIVVGDAVGTVWFLDWPIDRIRKASILASTRRHVILFLAANPSGITELALTDECAAIEEALSKTPGGNDFEFRSKWAVSVDRMMNHFNDLNPTIIHFSGHGSGRAGDAQHSSHLPRRDIGGSIDAGIYLQDQGHKQYVSASALARMIASAARSARMVVLNACFSDEVAAPLLGTVDCVVGMRGAIHDKAARSFAVAFYRALGSGCSVGNAVTQARDTLAGEQHPDEYLPVCKTREGISAEQLSWRVAT